MSLLLSLPDDCLLLILSLLSSRDRNALSRACRRLHRLDAFSRRSLRVGPGLHPASAALARLLRRFSRITAFHVDYLGWEPAEGPQLADDDVGALVLLNSAVWESLEELRFEMHEEKNARPALPARLARPTAPAAVSASESGPSAASSRAPAVACPRLRVLRLANCPGVPRDGFLSLSPPSSPSSCPFSSLQELQLYGCPGISDTTMAVILQSVGPSLLTLNLKLFKQLHFLPSVPSAPLTLHHRPRPPAPSASLPTASSVLRTASVATAAEANIWTGVPSSGVASSVQFEEAAADAAAAGGTVAGGAAFDGWASESAAHVAARAAARMEEAMGPLSVRALTAACLPLVARYCHKLNLLELLTWNDYPLGASLFAGFADVAVEQLLVACPRLEVLRLDKGFHLVVPSRRGHIPNSHQRCPPNPTQFTLPLNFPVSSLSPIPINHRLSPSFSFVS
ncbi:unnamed protein product [Closterium sp. NIES-65]|nr:unnamed protein product [Closterium sp. NIES-65]